MKIKHLNQDCRISNFPKFSLQN